MQGFPEVGRDLVKADDRGRIEEPADAERGVEREAQRVLGNRLRPRLKHAVQRMPRQAEVRDEVADAARHRRGQERRLLGARPSEDRRVERLVERVRAAVLRLVGVVELGTGRRGRAGRDQRKRGRRERCAHPCLWRP